MKQKEILLFGATGQIGRNLIRKLSKNNYKITVVTRNIHRAGYILKTQANPGYLTLVELKNFQLEKIEELFQTEVKEDEPIGSDPESGESIWLKKGPYGYYVQLGETKKRKGIPKGFSLSDVDLSYALKLLSLPREIGKHPENGEVISADYGRFGPYIKCGKMNASLRGEETPLDIELPKALELLKNRNKKK